MQESFPETVERGRHYGRVDAVMIGADIYGWATRALPSRLYGTDKVRLRELAYDLSQSIDDFPADAQPYYERLLRIAHLALER